MAKKRPSLKQVVEEYGLKVRVSREKNLLEIVVPQYANLKVPYIVEEDLPNIEGNVQSQVILGPLIA